MQELLGGVVPRFPQVVHLPQVCRQVKVLDKISFGKVNVLLVLVARLVKRVRGVAKLLVVGLSLR